MTTPDRQSYIDAVRGWAIILVIGCHVGDVFPALPYPARKLANFGWHGVQLFFLASAVTLLMSWHRQRGTGGKRVGAFFVRRFLRIAPLYYLGALVYLVAAPPPGGVDPLQLLRTLAFVNAWRPDWIATTPAGWTVVPGGWSIGVEVTFYLLFPALALVVTNLRRALFFAAATLVLAATANDLGARWLDGYTTAAADNFLYFWFFNQAPVFALGFVLYFFVSAPRATITSRPLAYGLIAAIGLACVAAAEHPGASNRFGWTTGVPTILVATLAFMAFVAVLARGPETWFTHPAIRRVGILSFGAYVLHFLFVRAIPAWSGGLIDRHATGYPAIAEAILVWVLTLAATLLTAGVAHRFIEQPAIDLAHRLTASRRPDPRPLSASPGAAE